MFAPRVNLGRAQRSAETVFDLPEPFRMWDACFNRLAAVAAHITLDECESGEQV